MIGIWHQEQELLYEVQLVETSGKGFLTLRCQRPFYEFIHSFSLGPGFLGVEGNRLRNDSVTVTERKILQKQDDGLFEPVFLVTV